jgi:hypothetical protein
MRGVFVTLVDIADSGALESAFVDTAVPDVGVPVEVGFFLLLSGVAGYEDPRRGVPFIACSCKYIQSRSGQPRVRFG